MIGHPVLAFSVGQFLGNAWQWAHSHPFLALGILVLVTAGVVFVAGPVIGFQVGGVVALAKCFAVGAVVSSVAICALGNIGSGGDRPNGSSPQPVEASIQQVVIARGAADSLDVEVRYRGDTPPTISTWNRYNVGREVELICDRLQGGEKAVQIVWRNVPARLRETVIGEFGRNGVSVREEVDAP